MPITAPALVIGDSPFTVYPGGVIAIPAVDIIGPARGTLSIEADARASNATGTVVRDTQKVGGTDPLIGLYNDVTAYPAAADTLIIPIASLLEHNQVSQFGPDNPSLMYNIVFSFIIEGDWNPADNGSMTGADQWELGSSAQLGAHGDYWTQLINGLDFNDNFHHPRLITEYYRLTMLNAIFQIDYDDPDTFTYYVRAYGRTGTTIEWLLDQVLLIPFEPEGGTPWSRDDLAYVDGELPDFSETETVGDWIDGADGGDDLGKFTLQPFSAETEDNITWAAGGGGDYQKKANVDDAEYTFHCRGDDDGDFYYLADSTKSPPFGTGVEEALAHCYGYHGAFWRRNLEWINDGFDRNIGDANFAGTDFHFGDGSAGSGSNYPYWGKTPEGFAWRSAGQGPYGPWDDPNGTFERVGLALFTEAGKGVMHMRRWANDDLVDIGLDALLIGGGSILSEDRGASIDLDANFSMSLKFAVTIYNNGAVPRDLADGRIIIGFNPISSLSSVYEWYFDIGAKTLIYHDWLAEQDTTGGTGVPPTVGPIDLSSWWGIGTEVGFHVEMHRYRLRWRVWDASGSEPSTWDYEDWRGLPLGFGPGSSHLYPYDDDLSATAWYTGRFNPGIFASTGVASGLAPEECRVEWDDVVITNDLLGDEGDISPTHYAVFQPNTLADPGTPLYQIEMPPGAQYWIYWGTRDWTNFVPFDGPYIDFAMKAWSEIGAPKMQRVDTYALWFRSVHTTAKYASIFWHPYKKELTHRRYGA